MQSILAGLIRHGLTLLGGGAAVEGFASNDQLMQWAGVLMGIVGTAWSVWKNRKKEK